MEHFSKAQPLLEQLSKKLLEIYPNSIYGASLSELEDFMANHTNDFKEIIDDKLADYIHDAIKQLKPGIFFTNSCFIFLVITIV
jgi:hypothetical protein